MASEPCFKSDVNESSFSIEKVCPICLDYPHNSVLLLCSSHEKGCSPYVCDTNHLHSNCLDRLKSASGIPFSKQSSDVSSHITLENNVKLMCPLCRGDVTGWVIVDKARLHFDGKKRCCEEKKCSFTGTYSELRNHAIVEHPHAHPSKIDPAQQLDWDNFQQSSEIIDVLSTIHSEVPHGVVFGDYVIEYGDDEMNNEFEDVPTDGNWWNSCILYQVIDNFRNSRNRRSRRSRQYSTSNSDDSVVSVEFPDYRLEEIDDDSSSTSAPSWGTYASSRRRRSRFNDNVTRD